MIQTLTLAPQQWHQIATGPHSIFWALGHVRIAFGDAEPTNDFDSLHLSANGQSRGVSYSGTESIWVFPIERTVHMQAVQIAASELFLIDAAGNVVVDVAGGLRP